MGSPGRTALVVALLAVVIRLVFALGHPISETADDALQYDRLAIGVVSSQGLTFTPGSPTTERPPGYPFFLAALFSLVGRNLLAVQIGQALLGGVTVVLTYLLGRRVGSPVVALVAAIGTAIDYHLILLGWMVLTETYFTFLLVVAVYLAAIGLTRPHPAVWAAAGAMAGFAALTRPSAILFGPVWAIAAATVDAPWRRRATLGMIALATCLVVVLPWTVRNYLMFREIIPVATAGGGPGLWFGGNPDTNGDWPYKPLVRRGLMEPVMSMVPPVPSDVPGSVREDLLRQRLDAFDPPADRAFTRAALAQILADPLARVRYVILNLGRSLLVPIGVFGLVERIADPTLRTAATWALGGAQITLVGFGTIAGMFLARGRRETWILLAAIAALTVFNGLVPGSARLRAPLEPLFFVFCGVAVSRLVGLLGRRARASVASTRLGGSIA